MNKRLTIFTPTYNRTYILPTLYGSLCEQTCNHFTWLVIDDGSTDDTESLIYQWIDEEKLDIVYLKTVNGGKARAINKAIEVVDSEYLFIVDSDDHLTKDAVETIYQWIDQTQEIDTLAGFAGLRGDYNGVSLNNKLDPNTEYIDAYNTERSKHNLSADCAEILRMSILKNYFFRIHPDEKFIPESYVLNAIAMDGYKIRWYNKVIYLCEYLTDGYTSNGKGLAENNPTSRAFVYLMYLNKRPPFLRSIYYTLYAIGFLAFKNDFSYLKEHPNKLICFLCFPMGYILGKWKKYQWRNV